MEIGTRIGIRFGPGIGVGSVTEIVTGLEDRRNEKAMSSAVQRYIMEGGDEVKTYWVSGKNYRDESTF